MLYEGSFIYTLEKKRQYRIDSTSKNADWLLSVVGTKCQSQWCPNLK